jgi:hypothetical protein
VVPWVPVTPVEVGPDLVGGNSEPGNPTWTQGPPPRRDVESRELRASEASHER